MPSFFVSNLVLGVFLLPQQGRGSSSIVKIREFAEEVAAREGCQLWDLEFADGPNRTLRVYIDKAPGGVSIEDCVNVSRGLNLRLDVEDVVGGGHYDLEVSSPGLDRKLTQLWHFNQAIGQTVQLRYFGGDDDEKSFEGKLVSIEGSKLKFENNKGMLDVDFAQVKKARILVMDVFQKKPAPGKKKR